MIPADAGEAGPADRPFVLLNMAMSADGKIATANRRVSSLGSARDLAHLYALRATADAVMCGARTADLAAVTLGNGGEKFRRLRLRRGLAEFPLRVLVSGSGTLNPQAHIFTKRFSPILLLTSQRAGRRRLAALRAVADAVRVGGREEVDFIGALRWLRRRWGVQRLLCEGGGELNDALFRAGVVDELHLTVCPIVLGGRGAPTIAEGRGRERLSQALPLQLKSRRRVGAELFLVFTARRAVLG
jgi:2,5-diamino-6-(ribosylamino)-4(3H)-pyrimidinone 5'-phosphate reductase